MSQNSKIEWTEATVNFWWGCTEVSPACAHCYAREWAKFTSNNLFGWVVEWGDGKPRAQRLEAARKEALKLNGLAGKAGQRMKVFANSMSDWLDDEAPAEWLAFLLVTIWLTPHLDWQLLTKRPALWRGRMEAVAAICGDAVNGPDPFSEAASWLIGDAPANVWIGTTVEDQTRADERIPHLLAIPAKVRFLSCEPLLGPVEFSNVSNRADWKAVLGKSALSGIHWVICGGESGAKARPMRPDWARSLRGQCAALGVPYFFKQWGESAPLLDARGHENGFARVGKKAAGRLLDGVEHNAFPPRLS